MLTTLIKTTISEVLEIASTYLPLYIQVNWSDSLKAFDANIKNLNMDFKQ